MDAMLQSAQQELQHINAWGYMWGCRICFEATGGKRMKLSHGGENWCIPPAHDVTDDVKEMLL